MKLLVATSNPGKLEEFRRILEPLGISVVPPHKKLKVEETGSSFLENAYIKAKAYWEEFGIPSVADDSGLIVDAIAPYPGVYSSRFHELELFGKEEGKSPDEANIKKLLRVLRGKRERGARFVAFVVLYANGKGLWAEGEVRGRIAESPRGSGGFGYDPVFIPEGETRTMAELSPEEKDRISHRGKALRALARILERCEEAF
ncbi:MAG: RdgB/HAM1 family non-canonical purine NTP pyrophosphatase [Aquificae bacterium]|nr:RdgB/HAM1 family non-canonical purine NTP pyrophosphatase [Aquificota bacterium]